MKRKILVMTLLAILTLQMSVFAATTGLVNDGIGFLYIQNNGVPVRSDWVMMDVDNNGKDEYYYFASDGHLTVNSKTEDGYMVNEKGQWVVDGVVQFMLSGTHDRGGLPYLKNGEQYTWGSNGPMQAPPKGTDRIALTEPLTGDVWEYIKGPSGGAGMKRDKWFSHNQAKAEHDAYIAKERKNLKV